MPSTYTLNNGIELISTGEQSGTWGDTTNTNLSLLDTALDGQVTVTLPSAGTSGSPNTLAITDGAASDGRNRMVTFADGGDLGATAFVQLTPNDSEKIIYVRNTLAGSRSIILFQGTYNASNDYEVPAGTTAVVYFDGAGSGAVAANVFNNAYFDSLRLGGVSVTAIIDDDTMGTATATNIATSESIKAYVDSQVTAQDLDFGGDSGTGAVDLDSQSLTIAGTSNEIETSASGQTLTIGLPDDVTIAGDLTVDTDTLYVDSTNDRVGVGTSSPSAKLDLQGTAAGNEMLEITHSGASQPWKFISGENGVTNEAFIIDRGASGEWLRFHAGLGTVFSYDNTERMRIDSSGNVGIGETSPSAALHVYQSGAGDGTVKVGNAQGGDTTNIGKQGSTTYGATSAGDAFVYTSTVNLSLMADGASSAIKFSTGGNAERMRIDSSGNVGIGTSSPSAPLSVTYGGGAVGAQITGNASYAQMQLSAAGANTNAYFTFGANGTGKGIIQRNATDVITIDSSGNVGIGTNSPTHAITVKGVNDIAKFYSDAAATELKIRTPTVNVIGLYTGTADAFTFGTADTERMRIDSSGSVGIGTSSPSTYGKLAVRGASTVGTFGQVSGHFSDASTGSLYISHDTNNISLKTDGDLGLFANNNDSVIISTNATERMRIDSSGNVGIGVTDPSTWSLGKALHIGTKENNLWGEGDYAFHMNQNAYYNGGWKYSHTDEATQYLQADGQHIWSYAGSGSANAALSWSEAMRISSSGNVGIGTSSPEAELHIAKSTSGGRGGTLVIENSHSSILNNEVQIAFLTDSGASLAGTSNARIKAINTDAGSGAAALTFTTWSGAAEGERMRISSSGNVGIGDLGNAATLLHIGSTGTPEFRVQDLDAGGGYLSVTHNAGTSTISADPSNSSGSPTLVFNTVNTERMRINSSGEVLFGCTSIPDSSTSGAGFSPNTFPGNHVELRFASASTSSTNHVLFNNPNGLIGSIKTSGSATSFNTSSDYRLKTDAQPMTGASARVQALNPVNFEWIADGTRVDGFLAHEAQAVVPEAVTGTKDAVDADGNPEYQGIDQSKLVPLLTAALQEALTKIDALETRITALEG